MSQPRRHTLALVVLVVGVLLFAGAFFMRVRPLALVGGVLMAIGAVLFSRKNA